jgi:hypothetical protein
MAGSSCGVVAHERRAIPNKTKRKQLKASFIFMVAPDLCNEDIANYSIRQV